MTVEVPVPVVKPLPESLTADCDPAYEYASGSIHGEAVLDRLAAVELALGVCRAQLVKIRETQVSALPESQ